MQKIVLAAITSAIGLAALAAPAAACPAGYHATWIQGHKICQIKPGGNGKLKANTGPKLQTLKVAKKMKRR